MMAAPNHTRHPASHRAVPPTSNPKKRKLGGTSSHDEVDTPNPSASSPRRHGTPNKKQHTGPSTSQITRTLPLEPHAAVLTELHAKYDVLTLSVLSSSKIEKRVTAALAHLGRFHPSDMAVRPGVIMLHARGRDAGKLISVAELVRRRVGESEQKWWQYNRLYEVETEAQGPEPSVVEETVVMGEDTGLEEGSGDENDEEDDFEVMPSRFADAVTEPKSTVSKPFMSITLSRIPIPELQAKEFYTCQSNEAYIEHQRRKRMGLA